MAEEQEAPQDLPEAALLSWALGPSCWLVTLVWLLKSLLGMKKWEPVREPHGNQHQQSDSREPGNISLEAPSNIPEEHILLLAKQQLELDMEQQTGSK